MGWSQNKLARQLPGHVESTTISRWELGKAWPSYPNVIALAEVFGITEEELICGDVPGQPAPKRRRNPTATATRR